MHFVFEAPWLTLGATALGITLVLTAIVLRRTMRSRYFRRRDLRVQWVRQHWAEILSGEIPASDWYFRPLDRQIVEEIALDRVETECSEETARLKTLFRESGLIDHYKRQARSTRGSRRRQATLILGRMGVVEAIPLLREILMQPSREESLAAVRALGRIATPEAGTVILRGLAGHSEYPADALESALAACYAGAPQELLRVTLAATDAVRPLLARVLAEVARPGLDIECFALASDPIADVRAAAARILAIACPSCALDLLANLATDPEWFVRLRAMIALKILAHPASVFILIRGLCDPNRLVRLRAATALAALDGHELKILSLTRNTGDQYALQALISELERSGKISRIVDSLAGPPDPTIESALLHIMRGGAVRMLVDLALRHPDPLVQQRLFHLLAQSHSREAAEYVSKMGFGAGRPMPSDLLALIAPITVGAPAAEEHATLS